MKLRFTPRAAQDLVDIAGYICTHNPAAAQRVRAAIFDTLRHLTLFPRAGRRQTVENVRKLVSRKYPYLVYYTIDDVAEEIVIITIRHPARAREHADA